MTYGESHGPAMGLILEGVPPNLPLTTEDVQKELDRRRPGQSSVTTQRKETDQVEILSGIFEGKTTGTPIGMIIRNQDKKSKDYSAIKDSYNKHNIKKGFHIDVSGLSANQVFKIIKKEFLK